MLGCRPPCGLSRVLCVCNRCRCSELEGKRLQDSERLTAVNTELSKLKELYWSKKGEAVSGGSRLRDVWAWPSRVGLHLWSGYVSQVPDPSSCCSPCCHRNAYART